MATVHPPGERWVDRAALALVGLAALALALHRVVEYDVWWQLATGARVLAEGWPRTDPFSYLAEGLPWIEMRWLYCVAAHLLFAAGGANALILAKVAVLAATLALLWTARSPGSPRWPALIGLALAAATGHPRWGVRPEIVTYLLIAWTLLALERYRRGGGGRAGWGWLASLPAIQLLWVNSHTLFVLGPVIQALFVAGEWLTGRRQGQLRQRLRPAALAAGASALVCLVNPYGWLGALFPFQLFGQIQEANRLSEVIAEFRSPFAVAGILHLTVPYALTVVVAATALWLAWRRRPRSARLPLSRPLIWLAFLYLSTLAHRNLALFGLVSAFVVTWCLGEWATDAETSRDDGRRWRARRAGWTVRLAVLVLAAAALPWIASDAYYRATGRAERTGLGVSDQRFPIRALELVHREDLPRPVVAKLGDSGYVLFAEGERSVAVDGRLEVYGPRLLPALRRLATGDGWDRWTAELGVDTAIVLHREQVRLLATLEGLPSWVAVYFDPLHVVYVRRTAETATAVERLAIDWQRPVARRIAPPARVTPTDPTAGLWPRVADPADDAALAQLFVNVGNLERAEHHLRQAVAAWPGHRDAALLLALVLEARGGPGPETEALLERAGRRRAESVETARTRALLLARAGLAAKAVGRFAEARAHFQRALRTDPDNPSLHNELGIANAALGDRQAARQAFERALALDPAYGPARANLERLISIQ